MLTTTYVVNKDWDALQALDPATYEGSTQEWIYSVDAFASIYKTIEDGNNIKIPGAVNPGNGLTPEDPDYVPASPIPLNGEGDPVVINVINGDFNENAVAAADANYTLEFSSIYNIETRPDLNTTFVGSFVSEAENNVGFKVSAAFSPTGVSTVNFGKEAVYEYKKDDDGNFLDADDQIILDDDPEAESKKVLLNTNRTTITLKNTDVCDFTVGGDDAAQEKATANVTNTDLSVKTGIWVGSADGSYESATDVVRYTLNLTDSTIISEKDANNDRTALLTVRNNGAMAATDSIIDVGDFVFRRDVTLTGSTLSATNVNGIQSRGGSNIYGETGMTAVLTATDSTIVVNAEEGFQIGGADNRPDRSGKVILNGSVLGSKDVAGETITYSSAITVAKYGTLEINPVVDAEGTARSQVYANTLTNAGEIDITIDADGEDWIQAGTFTSTGDIEIGGSFDGGVKRVIYAADGEVNKDNISITATSTDGQPVTAATRGGKVAIAAGVDYTTFYVSNAIDEDDDFAKTWPSQEPKDYYVDFNAFGCVLNGETGVKTAMESQKDETETILIDGTNAEALTYYGVTKASIDGLTFKKDGTNAVVDNPETEEDESTAEKDVTFALTGMDFADSADLRTLMTGITVEEGVVFSADKMYQRGADALTTINGTLLIKKYPTTVTVHHDAVEDDPTTDENEAQDAYDEEVAGDPIGDNFMIAGGEVIVNGNLIGGGTISANATNRDTTTGLPIPATLTINAGTDNFIGTDPSTSEDPVDNLSLVIGSNATVTITGMTDEIDGKTKVVSNDVWFQNVIMRRTIATNFVDPFLNITDAIVRVVSAFDTAKGTININFQSQLFVDGTAEIAGGTINLHVTDTDIALLNNVEKREMLYTVVHAPLNAAVVLTCDGDSNHDTQIDDTEYIYTSLDGRGLFVVHEDLATNLYVNAAWTDSDTKTYQFGEEVIKGKAYYGINAFNSFVDALSVAQDSPKATTIFVTSDVTDLYRADLFYKDNNGDAILFKGDLTIVSQNIDAQGVIGDLATPYTVTLKNQAGGRMDLCLSPEGALVVEDDADTAEDESLQSHPARTITFAAADAEKKTQSVTITVTKDDATEGAVAGGLWLDFWGDGGTVVVNNKNEANMLGTRGTLVVEETGTLKAQNLVIRSNNTVTVNGNDEVYTGENYQINATGDLILASGVMSVNDSNVYAEMIQFNDDNVITEGSFELVSSNTNWVVGTTIGTLFYKDHPVDADGNPTYTATLTFTEDSTVTVIGNINNVVTSAPDPSTFDGHGTPIDFVFDGSTLSVGKTLNNAGTLTLLNDATAIINASMAYGNNIVNSGLISVQDGSLLSVYNNSYGINNTGDIEVLGGTIWAKKPSGATYYINNTGSNAVITLDDADILLTGDLANQIRNWNSATIQIDGDVSFTFQPGTSLQESINGTILNCQGSAEYAGVYDGIVSFGVSNTVADVDVNIVGGTVMFSDDDLTFDWAVTGVSAATDTADEQIVSAKLFGSTVGATLYANKKGLTLTDSGFTVVDIPAVDDDPETADDESADAETHTVYNNTVAITVAANSDLTLDIDVESWSVTGLATEAASAEVTGSTAGTLKMDWTQDLTVAGNLDNVKGKIEISVSSFLGVLEGNKLLIDQYDPNATWQWKAESDDLEGTKYYKDIITISGRNTAKTDGWFIVEDNDLYLNAAAFAKVSQDHDEDVEDGWYQRFNNSAPTVNDGAADSDAPVILVLDGTFDESVFLNDKDTTFMGNVDDDGNPMVLKFTKIVAGGYDVSALDANEGTPTSLNIKTIPQEGGDVTSTTMVTINTGSFSNYVFGGDVVRLAADETKVNFFRTGGTDMTINGGEFVVATVGGQKVIAGGLYYYKAKGVATIDGTVNLTITGGTFKGYDVYGGNYASDKTLGKNTRIEGDVKLTLGGDATEDDTALVFGKNVNGTQGGKIFAGSYGAGNTSGNVEVVLTGDKDISVDRIWGGNSGDYRDAHGEVVSTIDGDRILTFDGFSGALTATSGIVEGFNKVVISDENVLNFAASDNFNKDVKVWEFAADASVSDTGSFAFDFSGDKVDMSALSAGWTLSNVTYDSATQFAFGAGIDFEYADATKTMTLVTLS